MNFWTNKRLSTPVTCLLSRNMVFKNGRFHSILYAGSWFGVWTTVKNNFSGLMRPITLAFGLRNVASDGVTDSWRRSGCAWTHELEKTNTKRRIITDVCMIMNEIFGVTNRMSFGICLSICVDSTRKWQCVKREWIEVVLQTSPVRKSVKRT